MRTNYKGVVRNELNASSESIFNLSVRFECYHLAFAVRLLAPQCASTALKGRMLHLEFLFRVLES